MKWALIIGITGQEGSLLAESPLAKGYSVVGTSREANSNDLVRTFQCPRKVDLVGWDMLDQQAITCILNTYRPNEMYNFAAYSSEAGMFDAHATYSSFLVFITA